MLIFGRSFRFDAQLVVGRELTCASCGHRTVAQVRGVGRGIRFSPFFLINASVRREAEEAAERNARGDADRVLSLVACSRCGARDSSAVRRFRSSVALKMLAPVLLALAVGGFFAAKTEEATSFLLFMVFGVAGAATFWASSRETWKASTARVAFSDPLPPDREGAGYRGEGVVLPRTGQKTSPRRGAWRRRVAFAVVAAALATVAVLYTSRVDSLCGLAASAHSLPVRREAMAGARAIFPPLWLNVSPSISRCAEAAEDLVRTERECEGGQVPACFCSGGGCFDDAGTGFVP